MKKSKTKTSRSKNTQDQDPHPNMNHVFNQFETMSHTQPNPQSQNVPNVYPQFVQPQYNINNSSYPSPNSQCHPYNQNLQYPQNPNHPQSSQYFQNSPYPQNQEYPNHSQSSSSYPSNYFNQNYNEGGFVNMLSESIPTQNTTPLPNVGVPIESSRASNTYYSQDEDILLAKAYVTVTDNAVTGADQKGVIYWGKIAENYNERAKKAKLEYRPYTSLLNRFSKMRSEMFIHKQALEFVNRNSGSGWNEVDKLIAVGAKFKAMNPAKGKNKEFKYEHVRKILEKCSKFAFSTSNGDDPYQDSEEETEPLTPHTHTSQVGSNPPSPEKTSGSKRCSDEISSPSRPMGNKASINERKGKKIKGKNLDFDFEDSYRKSLKLEQDERFANYVGVIEKKSDEKNQILRALVDVQERKLKAKSERAAKKDEEKIMNFNLDDCKSKEEREFMLQKRLEIMKRWGR